MRKVTIRQFHQNMWEEIKDLPLLVTKRGKDLFIVTNDSKREEVASPESLGVCSWDKSYKCKQPAISGVGSKAYCPQHLSDSE